MVRARTSSSVCLLLLACLACLASLAGCSGEGARAQSSREAGLTAHRGTFRQRLILSGELAAERGEAMNVPRTNSSQLTIRWLAPAGVPGKAGDPVVAVDNSQSSTDL